MADFSRNFRHFEFDKKGRNVVKLYLLDKTKNFSQASAMSLTNGAAKGPGRVPAMFKVRDCEGARIE
jgi:hypothetical protein